MRRYLISLFALVGVLPSCARHAATSPQSSSEMKSSDADFRMKFDVPKDRFTSTGRNPYFVLEPGHRMTYLSDEGESGEMLVVTVLNETKTLDGVETRIVEEHESKAGKPVEISRNYFAIDRDTNDIYYFGEDVDVYKNGKVESHPGGWHSGENGAHFGLFMPAKPTVGQKFYQEVAPGSAMDRVE